MSSVPGWGRSPGKGNGYPFQHSWPKNSMDTGACSLGYSPWGCKELDSTEWLSMHAQVANDQTDGQVTFKEACFPWTATSRATCHKEECSGGRQCRNNALAQTSLEWDSDIHLCIPVLSAAGAHWLVNLILGYWRMENRDKPTLMKRDAHLFRLMGLSFLLVC